MEQIAPSVDQDLTASRSVPLRKRLLGYAASLFAVLTAILAICCAANAAIAWANVYYQQGWCGTGRGVTQDFVFYAPLWSLLPAVSLAVCERVGVGVPAARCAVTGAVAGTVFTTVAALAWPFPP